MEKNYSFLETLLFYNIKNIDHYYYIIDYKNNQYLLNISNKMLDTYKNRFNNYHIDDKINKKYDIIIADIIYYTYTNINYNMTLQEVENYNIELISKLKNKLVFLQKNGDMIIFIYSCIYENTIKELFEIIKKFKKIKFYLDISYYDIFFPFIYLNKYDENNDIIYNYDNFK